MEILSQEDLTELLAHDGNITAFITILMRSIIESRITFTT